MSRKITSLRLRDITPSGVVVCLLASQLCLLMSHWLGWFTINEKKGCAVLIAVATAISILPFGLVWLFGSLLFHRRFQFGIDLLFLLTVGIAIPFSWLGVEMQQARQQETIVETIEEAGGEVTYDYEGGWNYAVAPPWPAWITTLFGVDFFSNVVCIDDKGTFHDDDIALLRKFGHIRTVFLSSTDVTDSGMEYIGFLGNIEFISLRNVRVTDDGLAHLKNLTKLEQMWITNTQVTENGVKDLQMALPKCGIIHFDETVLPQLDIERD